MITPIYNSLSLGIQHRIDSIILLREIQKMQGIDWGKDGDEVPKNLEDRVDFLREKNAKLLDTPRKRVEFERYTAGVVEEAMGIQYACMSGRDEAPPFDLGPILALLNIPYQVEYRGARRG